MNQALANKPKVNEDHPATQLVRLLDSGDLAAANQLTIEMATEAKEWSTAEWGKPEAAIRVKAWWIEQYRRHGLAQDAEAIWSGKPTAAELRAQIEAKGEAIAKALDAPEAKPVAAKPAKAMPWPDAPEAPDGATEIERLTYPVGLLGHVVQYIVDTARLPNRVMALAGALSACAKGLDRKVLGPSFPPNSVVLFILLIAETGAGKQHILNCIRIVLRAMGEEEAIVGTGIASVQSIDEILEGPGHGDNKAAASRPSALVTVDEYGSFLARISGGQGGNVSQIPAKLQTLWGWSPEAEYLGDIKVGKERVKVHGPAFSIFATSTEKVFFAALSDLQISSGFVNRHTLFNAGRGAAEPVRPKYDWLQCPEWLLKALKEVAGKPAPIDNRKLTLQGTVLRDFRRLGWGPGAEKLIIDFEIETRARPLEKDRELWIRAADLALRLATILAVFRGSATVDVEDLRWGIALSKLSNTQLQRGVDKHMLEEYRQANLVDYIRDEFRHRVINPLPKSLRGMLTQGQIRKHCERKCKDHRQIDAAIYHLVLTEEVIEVDINGAPLEDATSLRTPGKPTHRYKWIGRA